ncbi:MAG TPA: glycerophosphoryl diester phosphodiesterase membrane domain-containing protein [Gaiellaceae bacterium]|nr:glycerophosphoryl diester phosphodiesterase membrane domain-containing protein [Gaiellaceae bacterium]
MTVGGVLGEAIDLYQRFFTRFFLTAAAVFVVLNLFTAIAADAQSTANEGFAAFWTLVSLVVMLIGSLWLQGALTATVADVRDGRADDDIGVTFQRVRPYLGTLFVAGILAGVGIAAGFLLLVLPGLFLLTRWIVVTPVVVLEGKSATDALRRSWQLVRGHGLTVFGVLLLTLLAAMLAQVIFVALFSFLPTFLQNWFGGLVANSLAAPFLALAWTLMYFHLRGDDDVLPAPPAT